MSGLSYAEGGTQRYPVPDGYATPTEFAHILRTRNITNTLSPQRIYGFISDRKHPLPAYQNQDGRKILKVDEAIIWVVDFLQRRAEKDAMKAATTAREAEAAALAATTESAENSNEFEEYTEDELKEMWDKATPVDVLSQPPQEDEWSEWSDDFKA